MIRLLDNRAWQPLFFWAAEENILKLKKGRKLKNIKVDEVSLVKNPASRKLFLFFKSLEKSGELVCPECGYRLDYSGHRMPGRKKCPKCGTIMQCAAKKSEELRMLKDKHIDAVLESFEKEELEEIKLEAEYKEFLDEEMDAEQIEKAKKMPAEALNAIKAAFRMLNKWKEHLPSGLKSAVDLMAKIASGKHPYPKPYKKGEDGEEEDLEKAGRRISKFVSGQIWEAIKKLQALLPDDFKKEQEAEEEEIDLQELLKEAINAFVAKEENPEDKDAEEEADDSDPANPVLEKLEEISKRLEKVEKARGLKKGIESDGEKEGDIKKGDEEDPWTSLDIGE